MSHTPARANTDADESTCANDECCGPWFARLVEQLQARTENNSFIGHETGVNVQMTLSP